MLAEIGGFVVRIAIGRRLGALTLDNRIARTFPKIIRSQPRDHSRSSIRKAAALIGSSTGI